MKNRSVSLLLPTLLALAPAVLPTLAHAADEPDDIDGGSSSKPDKKKAASDEVVREIVKGLYARANVGGAFYLGRFAGFVNGGTYTSLGLGQDFVDAEKVSLAWELSFAQGIHNGCYYEYQAQGQCTGNLNGKESPWIEGDLRTYTLAATIEASFKAIRLEMQPLMQKAKYAYDSANPGADEAQNPLAPAVKAMIDKPFTVVLGPDGSVKNPTAPRP